MKDEDIDFSDIPKVTPEMFKNAVVRKGTKTNSMTSQETLAVDGDVIEFFKAQGRDYQTKIISFCGRIWKRIKRNSFYF